MEREILNEVQFMHSMLVLEGIVILLAIVILGVIVLEQLRSGSDKAIQKEVHFIKETKIERPETSGIPADDGHRTVS